MKGERPAGKRTKTNLMNNSKSPSKPWAISHRDPELLDAAPLLSTSPQSPQSKKSLALRRHFIVDPLQTVRKITGYDETQGQTRSLWSGSGRTPVANRLMRAASRTPVTRLETPFSLSATTRRAHSAGASIRYYHGPSSAGSLQSMPRPASAGALDRAHCHTPVDSLRPGLAARTTPAGHAGLRAARGVARCLSALCDPDSDGTWATPHPTAYPRILAALCDACDPAGLERTVGSPHFITQFLLSASSADWPPDSEAAAESQDEQQSEDGVWRLADLLEQAEASLAAAPPECVDEPPATAARRLAAAKRVAWLPSTRLAAGRVAASRRPAR